MFIAIDGLPSSGKSKVATHVMKYLSERGLDVVVPGTPMPINLDSLKHNARLYSKQKSLFDLACHYTSIGLFLQGDVSVVDGCFYSAVKNLVDVSDYEWLLSSYKGAQFPVPDLLIALVVDYPTARTRVVANLFEEEPYPLTRPGFTNANSLFMRFIMDYPANSMMIVDANQPLEAVYSSVSNGLEFNTRLQKIVADVQYKRAMPDSEG